KLLGCVQAFSLAPAMPHTAFSGLDFLDAAILALAGDGSLAYHNPAAADLLGLRDEQLGLPLETCLGSNSAIVQAVRHACRVNQSITEHEILLPTLQGDAYVSL